MHWFSQDIWTQCWEESNSFSSFNLKLNYDIYKIALTVTHVLLKTCMDPHTQCYASISVQSSGDCQDVNTRRRYNKVPEPPRYDNTRRRYNKVPEPPIPHYEAEIQQSTGAANTTYEAEIQQSTGAANTTYEAEIQQSTGAANTTIRDGDTITQQLQLLCTATIHRGRDTPRVPTAHTVTITLYCYNNTEAEIHQEYQQPTQLQLRCTVTMIPRPRYTKSTNSRYSYNYSVLLQ